MTPRRTPPPLCVLQGCTRPRHTAVTLRIGGVFRTADVCRRHAVAYAATQERPVPA